MNNVCLLDSSNIFAGDYPKDDADKEGLMYTEVAIPQPCSFLNPQFVNGTWQEGPVRQETTE